MPVRSFHLSPAKPGGRQASRPHSGRRTVRNALCFFLHERRNPPSGEKGGFVSRQSEAPAERMEANGQIHCICAEPVAGANRFRTAPAQPEAPSKREVDSRREDAGSDSGTFGYARTRFGSVRRHGRTGRAPSASRPVRTGCRVNAFSWVPVSLGP